MPGGLGRFFDGAPVLAATANAEGYLTRLGGAWTTVLGWSEEELTARPFIDFVHPEDVASTLEALDDLVEGERVANFDNRYRTADGQWIWLRWHASANEIDQIFAVAWDVSAEVEAEQDAARHSALLEAITAFQRSAIESRLEPSSIETLADALVAATGARDSLIATVAEVDGYPVLRPLWASTGFAHLIETHSTNDGDPTGLSTTGELRDLNTLVGSVVRTGQPIRCTDAVGDPRRSPVRDVECDRFLALPLIGGGSLLGVLALTDVDPAEDSRAASLLEPVATTLGTVLDHRVSRHRAEQASQDLDRATNLLTAVINDLDAFVVVSDQDGVIRFTNRAAEHLFGVASEEAAGSLTPSAFVAPGEDGSGPAQYLRWLRDPDHEPAEWTFTRRDGSTVPVLVRPSVLQDHDGRPDGWVQLGTELTYRKQVLAEQTRSAMLATEVELLRQRERELGLLAEAIEYVMSCATVDDAVGVIRSFMPRVLPADRPELATIGERESAEGETIRGIEVGDCWALRTGATHLSRAGRAIRCDHLPQRGSFICVPLTDGEHQIATISVQLPTDAGGDGAPARAAQGRVQDVARQMGIALSYLQLRRSLEQQANLDALTGIGNRRVAEAALDAALLEARSSGEQFGLLLFDLDDFKAINDERGHHTGDRVLREVASTLSQHVRPGDTVARLGGDEFVVVLRDLGREDTARVADLLRREVLVGVRIDDDRNCTVSVGALHVDRAAPATRLMALADAALYRAKASGRNRVDAATTSSGAEPPSDPAPVDEEPVA
jgi:diguanylate cyclase (GGDEF)-like protein/PAS domain S-box-containing protein